MIERRAAGGSASCSGRVASRRQVEEGAVQRWEYTTAYWYDNELRTVNGESLPRRDWSTIPFYQWLTQLGDEGWELVCVSEVSENSQYFFFKRPKE